MKLVIATRRCWSERFGSEPCRSRPWNRIITTSRTTRARLAGLARSLPADHLVTIPAGWPNHILWHLGHLVVTQARLVYARTGTPVPIDATLVALFAKGSRPSDWTSVSWP